MKILHISDLHVGSDYYNTNSRKILEKIKSNQGAVDSNIVVCSGDIAFKGNKNNYSVAKNLFDDIFFKSKKILLVPGNHDIDCNDKNLNNFNQFAININNDLSLFLKRSCIRIDVENISFILISSVYNNDHKYGDIHIPTLQNTLHGNTLKENVIAVTHHHFIPFKEDKQSSIRNSLDVLNTLMDFNCNLILHGHSHKKMKIEVGNHNSKLDILGTRSFLHDSAFPVGARVIEITENGKYIYNDISLALDE